MATRSAVVMTVPVLLVGCAVVSGPANRTTVPEVERRLAAVLPVGSTREQVEAWLTAERIVHSYSEPSEYNTFPRDQGSGYVRGIIRDTDHSLIGYVDIQLAFVFGDDGRLARREVQQALTGP